MRRIIALSMAVFLTPAAIVFLSANVKAQHGPGYTECSGKWVGAGRPNGWNEFMSNCLRSVQLVPEKQTPPVQPSTPGAAGQASPPQQAAPLTGAGFIKAAQISQRQAQGQVTPAPPGQTAPKKFGPPDYNDLVRIYGKDAVDAARAAHQSFGQFPAMMAQLNAERDEQLKAAAQQARATVGSSTACESGHWIEGVMSDGEFVKLEDDSLWKVDGGDQITAALWLPTTEIVVCDGKLLNTDDNESVEAERTR